MSDDMYCIQCKYHLKGLKDHRCPECGREFDPENSLTYSASDFRMHPVHSFIGALGLLLVLMWCIADGYSFDAFVDLTTFINIPSLIWVIGVVIAGLWMCFGPVAALKAILIPFIRLRSLNQGRIRTHMAVLSRGYQLAWAAGLAGVLLNMILYLSNMSDPASIGPAIAMSLFSPLYGLIIAEFFFSPLQQVLLSRTNVELPVELQLALPKRSVLILLSASVLLISLLVWSFWVH